MLMSRASEYLFPFLILFAIITLYEVFTAGANSWLPALERDDGSFLYSIVSLAGTIEQWFKENGKLLKRWANVALVVFFCATTLGLVGWATKQMTNDRYEGGAKFILKDSGGQGIVFTQFFHNYPPLVFYDSENKYVMGVDNIYTYKYDSRLYYFCRFHCRPNSTSPLLAFPSSSAQLQPSCSIHITSTHHLSF